MFDLTKIIKKDKLAKDRISLYWLGGAGFIIKNSEIIVGIDLYLSDFYYKETNRFKMFILPPIESKKIKLDYLIATHDHPDHFDIGSLECFVNVISFGCAPTHRRPASSISMLSAPVFRTTSSRKARSPDSMSRS